LKSKDIGKRFEDKAVNLLIDKGYQILDRNFHSRYGEIDIVAKDKDTVVFVEVRYRKKQQFGTAQESISFKKMEKIYKTALSYLSQKGLGNTGVRFDVVAFNGEEVEHIQNAFEVV